MDQLAISPIGRQAPTLNDLNRYTAFLSDAKEVIWQPLYDYQNYAAAGQLSLTFFSQGATGTKTYADTNLDMNGQLPAGMNFLCVAIEFVFWPAGSIEHTAANNIPDDTYKALGPGAWMEFIMLQKTLLREAPLQMFPQQTGLDGYAATNLTAAGDGSLISYARNSGPTYQITPIRITSSQNFAVKVSWPTLVPISAQAKIGCRLLGYTYRNAQ